MLKLDHGDGHRALRIPENHLTVDFRRLRGAVCEQQESSSSE